MNNSVRSTFAKTSWRHRARGLIRIRKRGAYMSKVRVAGFGLSLDGFSAGIEQSLDDPLGKRGQEIFQWYFHTKAFRTMHGEEGGSTDMDDVFARRAMEGFGAFILGRNMFGPVRGPGAIGAGEALLTGIDLRALGFSVTEHAATDYATHVVLTRD